MCTPATVSRTIGPMNFSIAPASTPPISLSRSSSEMTAPGTPDADRSKPVKVTVGDSSATSKRPLAAVTTSVPRMRVVVARIVMSVSASMHAAA